MTSPNDKEAAEVVDNNNSLEEAESTDSRGNTTPDKGESQDEKTSTPMAEPERKEVKDVTLSDFNGMRGAYSGSGLVLRHTNTSSPSADEREDNDGIVKEELVPDGQGAILYDDNHPSIVKYSGGWENGAYSQQGVAIMKNGDLYTGEHVQGKRHGTGTYKWADGRKYAGEFQNDQRHGCGRYEWPCGAVFSGSYVEGVRNGYGSYHDPTEKISYMGDWKNGKYHGYGVLTSGENDEKIVYRGNFGGPQGRPHGYGVEVNADGSVRHDGEWVDGEPVTNNSQICKGGLPKDVFVVVEKEDVCDGNGLVGTYRGILNQKTRLPCGNGTLTYFATSKNNDECLDRYEGCFDEKGRYHGRGRLIFKSGDVYDGDFHDGKRQGSGTYRWSDGKQYKGQFWNDLRHGRGVFVYGNKSSDWYEGEFVEGHRSGKGRFVFSDGSTYEGEWNGGVYHGNGSLVGADGKTYTGGFQNGVAHGFGKEVSPDGNVIYEGAYFQGLTVTDARRKEAAAKQLKDKTKPPTRNLLDELNSNASPTSVTDFSSDSSEPACEAVVDIEVNDAEGNLGQYTGLVLVHNQRPHGVGRMVYLDGRRIHEGFWHNGAKQGHGRCLFQQGDFHEGEYLNNVRHGPGRYEWKDGRSFIGRYENDVRDGPGVFVYPNGNRFEGVFTNGERSSGRFEFGDGWYEGEWKKGAFHGVGTLEYKDGRSYEGRFIAGKFVGPIKHDVVDQSSEQDQDQPVKVAQPAATVGSLNSNGVAAAQIVQVQ